MADFYLVRFANRQEAAEQVTALQKQKGLADFKPPKDVHDFITSLVREKPPKPPVTGKFGEITDIAFLASILNWNQRDIEEITSEDVIVELLHQDNKAVNVRVSEIIKEQLESAGIEFTVIARLHRD